MAALGLTASQAAALGNRLGRRTALQVAVASSSAEAAGVLLCAGASLAPPAWFPSSQPTVFRELLDLAKRTAVEPGAAAAAVPEAVQRMASVLLAQGLPPGAASWKAHETAVKLAYPKPPPGGGAGEPQLPPCDGMLQRLLQMHTSGQLGDAHASAVADVVKALIDRAAGQPGVEAAVAQWLSVPAAADIEAHMLQLLGCRMLEQGVAGEALTALLAQPGTADALQQRASQRAFDSLNVAFQLSLVASAAASERSEALDAVLAAGGAVTLNDVNQFSAMRWRSRRALTLLLSRGVPPVPLESPPGQVFPWSACPVYTLLQGFCRQWELVFERECMKLDGGILPSANSLQELHAEALALMDVLADAGYRPVQFRNYPEHNGPDARVLPTFYPPTDAPHDAAKWDLAATSKWLWLAAQREPWSPGIHVRFPPALRAAVRTVLLAAHRASSTAGAQSRLPGLRPRRPAQPTAQEPPSAAAAGLAVLPTELLHRVLRLAAYPVSAWRPRIQEGRMLSEIEQMRSYNFYF